MCIIILQYYCSQSRFVCIYFDLCVYKSVSVCNWFVYCTAGRGGNKWLSPLGCGMFTLHLQVAVSSRLGQRISFLQHLAALAVVEAVRTLPGYEVRYHTTQIWHTCTHTEKYGPTERSPRQVLLSRLLIRNVIVNCSRRLEALHWPPHTRTCVCVGAWLETRISSGCLEHFAFAVCVRMSVCTATSFHTLYCRW